MKCIDGLQSRPSFDQTIVRTVDTTHGSHLRCKHAYVVAWRRIGRNTASAINAATMLRIAAITKTAVQLPVQVVSTLPNGTNKAAVPFAVYSMP